MTGSGRAWLAAALLGAVLAGSTTASAGGYPPFYGYSGYFGGPTTTFTRDPDVQQATTREVDGFDTRTYYRGGPFWTYAPNVGRAAARERAPRRKRSAVLRRRG